ncbi:MAG: hypothetical protein FRX49_06655 [Trebouxia sp. A1-2]|nr:MAG: hypothetical protein FRX49_06655 [Trebouxia sp. A1-2]
MATKSSAHRIGGRARAGLEGRGLPPWAMFSNSLKSVSIQLRRRPDMVCDMDRALKAAEP